MPQLQLIVPSLFGSRHFDINGITASLGSLSALEALLSNAERVPGLPVGFEATLFNLAGAILDATNDLPVAPTTHVGDTGQIDTDWWLRADPVHLRADRDQLVLLSTNELGVTPDEAQALVTECNEFFSEKGWRFEAPHPQRWYLRLPDDPKIRTTQLGEVKGQPIFHFLPQGERGSAWRPFLNEIQMLLHASEVNQRREAQGILTINSVWLWGGGQCPEISTLPWSAVWSDDPLVQGLAQLTSTPCHATPSSAKNWNPAQHGEGHHLIVLPELSLAASEGDPEAWLNGLQTLTQAWFEPLLSQLKSREISQLTLYCADGIAYRSTPRLQKRFWRRRQLYKTFAASHRMLTNT